MIKRASECFPANSGHRETGDDHNSRQKSVVAAARMEVERDALTADTKGSALGSYWRCTTAVDDAVAVKVLYALNNNRAYPSAGDRETAMDCCR